METEEEELIRVEAEVQERELDGTIVPDIFVIVQRQCSNISCKEFGGRLDLVKYF